MKLTKFTAGLLALSIATAGISAAPARASEQDAALALGGLLTLFVIGKAIENKGRGDATVSRAPAPQHREQDWDRYRERGAAFRIPNQCVVSAKRGPSQRLVALERCVDRESRAELRLPRACETRVKTRGHWRDAYDVGCLSNFGYRVTRERRDWDRSARWHD